MLLEITRSTGFWIGLFAGSYLLFKTTNVNSYNDHKIDESPSRSTVLANRVCSMTHALGTLYMATQVVFKGPAWNLYNTPEQNSLIVFSCSYYLADTLYVAFIEPSRMFLLHHGAMISYWSSCLYLNQGGYAGALVLIPGEITNPLQIPWSLANRYRLKRLKSLLSPPFTYFFLFVRGVCLPVISPIIWYRIGRQPTPNRYWKSFWISLGLGIIGASGVWGRALWNGYLKHCSKNNFQSM